MPVSSVLSVLTLGEVRARRGSRAASGWLSWSRSAGCCRVDPRGQEAWRSGPPTLSALSFSSTAGGAQTETHAAAIQSDWNPFLLSSRRKATIKTSLKKLQRQVCNMQWWRAHCFNHTSEEVFLWATGDPDHSRANWFRFTSNFKGNNVAQGPVWPFHHHH